MINAIKIPVTLLEDEPTSNWILTREHDGLTKQSAEIIWLEWNEDSTFKEKHDNPAVGRSLLMSPVNQYFTWQTTIITEILEEDGKNIKFKTENSIYDLKYIGNE
jgi:hypothetical protein